MDSNFGVGVAFAIAVLLVAMLIWFFSGVTALYGVAYDCVNYGKTNIHSKWYECKPLEAKEAAK